MIETKKQVVKCMLCDKTTTIETLELDFYFLITMVAQEQNWAMSWNKDGGFVCCPGCYSTAFDLSQGGKVGFLRPEYNNLRRKK